MIHRLIRLEGVETTWLVHHNIDGILRPLLLLASAGILVDPHVLLLPWLLWLLRLLLLLLGLLILLIS
jgi:hypothetical protein